MLTEREERIVAFLRREMRNAPGALSTFASGGGALLESPSGMLERIIKAIEAGDHLKRPEPTIPASEWVPKPSVGR